MKPAAGLDWDALTPLEECGEAPGTPEQILCTLEEEWSAMLAGGEVSAVRGEQLDEFFARSLRLIESLPEEVELRPWWDRIWAYVETRWNFMVELRPRMYRQASRQELRRFKAPFDAWRLCVSEEGWKSSLGLLFRSYGLELAARLAPTWSERESLFREASQVCLDETMSPADSFYSALQRRSLVLESHALRTAAFALLNKNPADLEPVERLFRQARDEANKAQGVWFQNNDTHADYLGFWAEAVALRRAEVDGDVPRARSAHEKAGSHLESFTDPEVLFKEPNLWWNAQDFWREQLVIDAIEAVQEGALGLARAVNTLTKWVNSSLDELKGTSRLRQLELRLRSLTLLQGVLEGADVVARAHGLLEEVRKETVIWRHNWEIARQVVAASKGRVSIADALAKIGLLFPLDAQGPIASVPDERWTLLPYWYQSLYNRYRRFAQPDAAVVVLGWYVCTIADYLWGVYVKKLVEQTLRPPDVVPDLMLVGLADIRRLLSGLARAMCWSGWSGQSLNSLIELLKLAENASAENLASEILPAVIEETFVTLFPLPARVIGPDQSEAEADAVVLKCFRSEERDIVVGPVVMPSPGAYVYLKPSLKRVEGKLRQDKLLNLFPARSFGIPGPVLLLCEGDSDQAVFEMVLDNQLKYWRQLQITIVSCQGDSLPARFEGRKKERPVVVADCDKQYRMENRNKKWNRVWEHCCYGFLLEPDLERVDIKALSSALTDFWGCEVTPEELRKIDMASTSGNEFRKAILQRFGQATFKTRAFGLALGKRFVEWGIPRKIDIVCKYVLQLANGRQLPCHIEESTQFHHCIPAGR